MEEKRRIVAWMDNLLSQIFEYHTVTSRYQKLTDGKNQCLNFPKADEYLWEGCEKEKKLLKEMWEYHNWISELSKGSSKRD